MYTQCPNCNTTFHLSAEQMSAAHGQACCGKCMKVFDAVKYLQDELPEIPPPSSMDPVEAPQSNMAKQATNEEQQTPNTAPKSVPQTEETPENTKQASLFDVPEQAPEQAPGQAPGQAPEQALEQNQGQAPEQAPQQSTGEEIATKVARTTEPLPDASLLSVNMATEDETGASPSYQTLDAKSESIILSSLNEEAFSTDMADESGANEADTMETASPQEPAMPYFLVEQTGRPRRGPLATLAGMMFILLLSALAAGQYVYHQRDTLARNPEFKPWLEQVCEVTGCVLTPYRDTTAFELLERDVRFHPGHEDALLISASFVNHADFSQPYPSVELELKNMDGKVVAQRRFQPKEYLNTEQPLKQGIAARQEATLLIEVSDPGLEAVSFEFNFL